MIPRRAPVLATWLLHLVCSRPEHEALVGDLAEQYRQGHGRVWYWRQVLNAVFFVLSSKTRRPLTPRTQGSIVGPLFAALIVIAAVIMLLLSDVSFLLVTVVAGVFLGLLKFAMNGERSNTPSDGMPSIVRIDSSKIPMGRGAAAGILILVLSIAVLHDVPPLRFFAVPGLLMGLLFAGLLRLWGKLHPRDISKDWLSIKSK